MNLKKGTLYFITRKFITKSCKENCGLAIFRISYFNHHLCKLCCISSRRNLSKIEIKKVDKWIQIDSIWPHSSNTKVESTSLSKNRTELKWYDILPYDWFIDLGSLSTTWYNLSQSKLRLSIWQATNPLVGPLGHSFSILNIFHGPRMTLKV